MARWPAVPSYRWRLLPFQVSQRSRSSPSARTWSRNESIDVPSWVHLPRQLWGSFTSSASWRVRGPPMCWAPNRGRISSPCSIHPHRGRTLIKASTSLGGWGRGLERNPISCISWSLTSVGFLTRRRVRRRWRSRSRPCPVPFVVLLAPHHKNESLDVAITQRHNVVPLLHHLAGACSSYPLSLESRSVDPPDPSIQRALHNAISPS